MKIKTIIFDCYGTLLQIPYSNAYPYLFEALRLPAADYRRICRTSKLDVCSLVEYHKSDLEEAANIVTQFQMALSNDLANICPYPNVLALLPQLQAQYQVCILSNLALGYDRPIRHYFPSIPAFLSFELGRVKPDIALFSQVLDNLNAQPETTLLVDDKLTNLSAAQSLGMQVLHIDYTQKVSSACHNFSDVVKHITTC